MAIKNFVSTKKRPRLYSCEDCGDNFMLLGGGPFPLAGGWLPLAVESLFGRVLRAAQRCPKCGGRNTRLRPSVIKS